MNKLLFICVGNLCRSPMAAAIFKNNLANLGLAITIDSAGLHAVVNAPAAAEACELMRDRGLDISQHRSRQLTNDMLLNRDLILVMEDEHKRVLEMNFPSVCGRVFLLGHWSGFEITDPFGQSKDAFIRCVDLIDQAWMEWKDKLCKLIK